MRLQTWFFKWSLYQICPKFVAEQIYSISSCVHSNSVLLLSCYFHVTQIKAKVCSCLWLIPVLSREINCTRWKAQCCTNMFDETWLCCTFLSLCLFLSVLAPCATCLCSLATDLTYCFSCQHRLCGVSQGLICGLICFKYRGRSDKCSRKQVHAGLGQWGWLKKGSVS